MMNGYMAKMNIVLPKATINVDKEVYTAGSNIKGTIEVKGGLLKQKVKRYDLDLLQIDPKSSREETINSHTVLFPYSSMPGQQETIPFSFYLPESIKKGDHSFELVIRIVFENSRCILHKLPILISPPQDLIDEETI